MKNSLITMAHGDGGEVSNKLIKDVFVTIFKSDNHSKLDAAVVCWESNEMVVSTDSFIVTPLFFPGGDIGKLAICGTCNDIAVSGAKPVYLTCSFLIEEGFLLSDLKKIAKSMQTEAEKNGVQIIAGDTKVVEKGSVDGIFINTTGVGHLRKNKLVPENIKQNDSVLISGTVGDHGVAILSARGELGISSSVISDCASLVEMIEKLQSELQTIRIMRDPTRGGLVTSLVEIAEDFSVQIVLEEEEIPISDEVHGVCDIIGYDPFYLANEGKLIVIVGEDETEAALNIMNKFTIGKQATKIGVISEVNTKGSVYLKSMLGNKRKLSRLVGSMLPRIC